MFMQPTSDRLARRRLAVAIVAALASAQAFSQVQPSTLDKTEATSLDTIVVTAQKRDQPLQDVPVAVTYIDGSQLETAGGFNVESLKMLVPSLNIRKTNTSLNQALFLRGVGTINFAIAAQPSVAFTLDGVVFSSAGEAFGDLYDVNRIEVLRGPQGTLFGKNSSAGVVNVLSRMPGTDFGGYVDVGWFEDNERRVKAAVDLLCRDAELRQNLGQAGYDYVQQEYSWPAVIGRLKMGLLKISGRNQLHATADQPALSTH